MNITGASFRDPAGFVYEKKGKIFRQINPTGFSDYKLFMQSGLYDRLLQDSLVIPHRQVAESPEKIIIEPERVPFISYPYEWSFPQYKDAALALLKIQKIALQFKLSLKDASAYNMQFFQGRPVLIDTLSFEALKEGMPWAAYKQFCQHFIAPLALAVYVDAELLKLMHIYINGVPLNLASSLLPSSARFKLSILIHIYLHAKMQKKFENAITSTKSNMQKISLLQAQAFINNLESCVKSLSIKGKKSQWGGYYKFTNYTQNGFNHKKAIVEQFIKTIKPGNIIDLGANNGEFTRIACKDAKLVIAFDIDHNAVEVNYLKVKSNKEKNVLPLLQDFSSPSSAIGWNNEERLSLRARLKADCVMALALIHHIVISNNVPLSNFINWLADAAPSCIIEFVPKEDSKVQTLLATREDIFTDYTIEGFEQALTGIFEICEKIKIQDSCRTLYLLKLYADI